jgi:hypothetical protein
MCLLSMYSLSLHQRLSSGKDWRRCDPDFVVGETAPVQTQANGEIG